MQKLSIIVPCFNVEDFIYQCLKSIKEQTYQNIEVICIDNHSTDDTLNILREFSKIDPRFTVIEKASNTGYGDSLNFGIKIAKGQYIGIVEGDDFIDARMYEVLMNKAVHYNLDISRGAYWYYEEGLCRPEVNKNIPKNKLLKPLEVNAPFFTAPSIWAAIYRTQFIRKNKIHFLNTPGASYQDLGFSFKTYLVCERFMMVDQCLLYYRQHNSSSVRNNKGLHFVRREWEDNIEFALERPEKLKKIRSILSKLINYSYKWNYQRLHKNYRHQFIRLWQQDLQKFSKNIPIYSNDSILKNFEIWSILKIPSLYPILNFLSNFFNQLKNKCQF